MMDFISRSVSHVAAIGTGCDPDKTFFGLPVWYKYLPVNKTDRACDFSNVHILPSPSGVGDIPLIGLAVLDMLVRLGGLVFVVMILYGGAQYVLSQGEPDKTKGAMTTIINGCIGVGVTIIVVPLIAFLGNRLGG
jgi:hypothetical protein